MVTKEELFSFIASASTSAIVKSKGSADTITGPRNIIEANKNQLSFINEKVGDKLEETISNSKAGIILILNSLWKNELLKLANPNTALVICNEPKKVLLEACKQFFYLQKPKVQIHPSAHISELATIAQSTTIAQNVVSDENVIIGENCWIEPNVVIGKNIKIGNYVIIKANTTIGGFGFGYVKQEDNSYTHLPHFGNVVIHDDVHIGSNTCIDRGSLSDTIIHKGVKIDNLVHIAHNVEIGENSLIIACTMIAGSVKIGKNSWVAPSVSIRNGIEIGENTTVGLGSVVTGSIPSNETYLGVPAMQIESYKKLRKLQKITLSKKS